MSLKRQGQILTELRHLGSCAITELASRLGVTTETIRRTVKPLLERGDLLHFHGGLMLPPNEDEPPFQRRLARNALPKRDVAALVLGLVKNGDALILDNGTTTTYVADALRARSKLVVVTNSAQIASRLAGHANNRVFMAGGELAGDDAASFGPQVVKFLRQFDVKAAILSTAGINWRGDFVDFHMHEAEFARAAMARAEEAWFVADASKFGREAPVRVCPLHEADLLITNAPPVREFVTLCAEANTQLLFGGGGGGVGKP
ncbi:DeoR/GlpR family DNA-binding transcription regulator [Acidocella sp.]|uniref:DeoR/GlpR family DNA-binding transcription regulator n=1 Tax=Acidocella sp. TaxID=50710 RepID=UPI00263A1A95|nr:DeoR/GlpR family DNA-binding transcription regulator [Acidocella sp.]